ncbi:MAG: tetratricopeptide repeat protein [Woeseiaceae bacterium]
MIRNGKFWTGMAVFQIAFGLGVFALTRQYYLEPPTPISSAPATSNDSGPGWSENITAANLEQFDLSVPSQTDMRDPVDLSRQANSYFANGQYAQAADLYEKLLVFGPDNADTYNNLGLTLHYLGRSDEALARLNEGIAADASHQRTWLTIGFVNSQLGNTESARTALTNAVEMGADAEIKRSATEMLNRLP